MQFGEPRPGMTDGKALRKQVPRASHGEWSPAPDRPDPIALLEQQNEGRLEWLLPERRARMLASAFSFYRGAARVMAADLGATPRTGLKVQLCGDAHVANFGAFASPERQLVFDLNDFDETLPGPWEWDVKRLAASLTIAGRHRELDPSECRLVTKTALRVYREAIADLAGMKTLDLWYTLVTYKEVLAAAKEKNRQRRARKLIEKAEARDNLQALGRFADNVNGVYRIKNEPPDLVPLRELADGETSRQLDALLLRNFETYRRSLPDHCKRLLNRFQPVEAALRVVGVGSVGTRCMILMLKGRSVEDPLFLQIKQASRSVLEEFLEPSVYDNCGRRVVEGQHLMQTVSDIFLGWAQDDAGTDYYWRQLRDWKGSSDLEGEDVIALDLRARMCGFALARAHARSGDPVAISGYLGTGTAFDEAVADFSERYADQNERDYQSYKQSVKSNEGTTPEKASSTC